MANSYISWRRLSLFLDNIKTIFAPLTHKHTISEISDYVVDSELSATSTNPVANSVLDAEFEAVSQAVQVIERVVDTKADAEHDHDDVYDALGAADTALAYAKEYADSKIFVGTYAEYEAANANNEIPVYSLVVITDDENLNGGSSGGSTGDETTSTSTSPLLGTGALGYMVLA